MPEQEIDPEVLNQTRREISRLVAEIEQLAQQEMSAGEFYGEFLRRVQVALAAWACALWMRTPSGNLQLQSQVNLQNAGVDLNDYVRHAHHELLRHVLAQSRPMLFAPNSGPTDGAGASLVNNPTQLLLVAVPILLDGQAIGLVEVFQDPARRSAAHQGYLQFASRMAGEVGKFLKNSQFRQMLGQQKRWNQVDAFSRSVHGGLNARQVAYLIANEGKRLIECERLSVALARGRKTRIEAISGQDVVEHRSNLVNAMAKLAGAVLKHGENLIYTGAVEEHWPQDIKVALEHYLREGNSKLVAVVPLTDQREFGLKGKAKGAIIAEMIEDAAEPEEMGARVEVVARHGSLAIYNALEHQRVFLLPVWRVVGNATQTLGHSTLSKAAIFSCIALATILALILIPWPLKLEGRGDLVPKERRTVFAPVAGMVKSVKVKHNDQTEQGSLVAEMSNPQLERELSRLQGEVRAAEQLKRAYEAERQQKGKFDAEIGGKITEQTQMIENLRQQILLVQAQMENLRVLSPVRGRVMDWMPREKLLLRPVEQGEALLEVADTSGPWVLEVEFPESVVTHIARARRNTPNGELPVTFVLSASPEKTYHGRLIEFSTQARVVEQENVLEAKVAIDPSEDLALRIKDGTMPAGIEVRAKVDCGPHSLGYVLFRQVIDFAREYVFF